MNDDELVIAVQKLELKKGQILFIKTKNPESLREVFEMVRERHPHLKETLDQVPIITFDEDLEVVVVEGKDGG